jgi:tRNA A37 N6-isopentenylltransferase MiaA
LHARLEAHDPQSARRLHRNDLVRQIRALEVLELTGKKMPRNGLEAKFSVYHACAAGLVFGRPRRDHRSGRSGAA